MGNWSSCTAGLFIHLNYIMNFIWKHMMRPFRRILCWCIVPSILLSNELKRDLFPVCTSIYHPTIVQNEQQRTLVWEVIPPPSQPNQPKPTLILTLRRGWGRYRWRVILTGGKRSSSSNLLIIYIIIYHWDWWLIFKFRGRLNREMTRSNNLYGRRWSFESYRTIEERINEESDANVMHSTKK